MSLPQRPLPRLTMVSFATALAVCACGGDGSSPATPVPSPAPAPAPAPVPLPAPTPGQPAAGSQLTLMAGPLLPSEFGLGCFDAPDGVGAEVRFRSVLSMTEAPGGSVVMAEWAGPNAEHCPTPPRAVRGARGGG